MTGHFTFTVKYLKLQIIKHRPFPCSKTMNYFWFSTRFPNTRKFVHWPCWELEGMCLSSYGFVSLTTWWIGSENNGLPVSVFLCTNDLKHLASKLFLHVHQHLTGDKKKVISGYNSVYFTNWTPCTKLNRLYYIYAMYNVLGRPLYFTLPQDC